MAYSSVATNKVKFNSSLSSVAAKASAEKGTIHFTTDGEIILNGQKYSGVSKVEESTTNGKIKVDGVDVSVYGLKSAAFTESSDYATAVQGGKADSAVQTIQIDGKAQTKTNGVVNLPAYPRSLPSSDVTDDYSETGKVPVSGTAVAKALGTLDVTGESNIGSGKTIKAWSETDGKVSIITQDIQITEDQVTNLTDHLAAKAPLNSPDLTGVPTAPTAAAGTDTSQIATTAFVQAAVGNLLGTADALIYKGTLNGSSDGAGGGTKTPAADKGHVYKVATAGTINGVSVEVGDMLICNTDNTPAATANNYSDVANNWDIIQRNEDGVVTGPSSSVENHIAVFNGTSGKRVKDSGFTIATSVPANAVFTDYQATLEGHYAPAENNGAELNASVSTAAEDITNGEGVTVVTGLKRDAKGHVVGLISKKIKSINTNTEYTEGTGITISDHQIGLSAATQASLAKADEAAAALVWE